MRLISNSFRKRVVLVEQLDYILTKFLVELIYKLLYIHVHPKIGKQVRINILWSYERGKWKRRGDIK